MPTNQENNLDAEQGELEKKSFWDGITGVLSFSNVQSSYEPRESANVDIEATATEDFNADGSERIVTIYKCADSSCEDPPPIDSSSEDQCSSEEWWPEYDDCIASHSDTANFDHQIYEGTTWTWEVSFDAPSDEAQYILVGYIFKNGFVTDTSKEKFRVEEATSDSDGDGVIDSNDECPGTPFGVEVDSDGCEVESDSDGDGVTDSNDECSGTPSGVEVDSDGCPLEPQIIDKNVNVDTSGDTVSATIDLENTGNGDMTDTNVVEMQVQPRGTGLLSFVSNTQEVCDSEYPRNVHKEYRLDSGDKKSVTLNVDKDKLEEDVTYDIRLVTRSKCYYDDPVGNDPVEPLGSSEVFDTYEPPQVLLGTDGKISVEKRDGKIVGEMPLKNFGGKDMPDKDILEMQVRKEGSDGVLSFVSSTTRVCDSDHPENVNKKFRLLAGESRTISLSVDMKNLSSGTKEIYFVTAEECGGDWVEPFNDGGRIYETVNVSDREAGTDSDGDGIPDVNDGCPQKEGPASNNGCPEENGIPIIPIVAGFGLLAAGGAVYRYG